MTINRRGFLLSGLSLLAGTRAFSEPPRAQSQNSGSGPARRAFGAVS